MSRRAFVMGGLGALLLTSCGSTAGSPSGSTVTLPSGSTALVALFAATSGEPQVGFAQRLPFALADRDGSLREDVPSRLRFEVWFEDRPIGQPTDVEARGDGIDRPYYPLTFTPEQPGLHRILAEVEGDPAEVSILVSPALDSRLHDGDRLPRVATPTPQRPRGVVPYCTSVPACPLHEPTLRDALEGPLPLAVLVASPGTCAVSYCPPALELVLGAVDNHPRVRFLHAEVYADAAASGPLDRTTPVVQELGLDFEPALFLVNADGVIRRRLDHIFDRSELEDELNALAR